MVGSYRAEPLSSSKEIGSRSGVLEDSFNPIDISTESAERPALSRHCNVLPAAHIKSFWFYNLSQQDLKHERSSELCNNFWLPWREKQFLIRVPAILHIEMYFGRDLLASPEMDSLHHHTRISFLVKHKVQTMTFPCPCGDVLSSPAWPVFPVTLLKW